MVLCYITAHHGMALTSREVFDFSWREDVWKLEKRGECVLENCDGFFENFFDGFLMDFFGRNRSQKNRERENSHGKLYFDKCKSEVPLEVSGRFL